MADAHRAHVDDLLQTAAQAHRSLLAQVPERLARALPVDAQGITQAIDYIAGRAGLDARARRRLQVGHAINPAVMHARVFGAAELAEETVMGSFVEGSRVRADSLRRLGRVVGGPELEAAVNALLVEHPLPLPEAGLAATDALRASYAAQERAALRIAGELTLDAPV